MQMFVHTTSSLVLIDVSGVRTTTTTTSAAFTITITCIDNIYTYYYYCFSSDNYKLI